MGVIHFDHPWFLKQFENLMWVLNFFHLYMTIDIAYFLYIFGDNGAYMLLSCTVNKMC